jgi:hypothetical protein
VHAVPHISTARPAEVQVEGEFFPEGFPPPSDVESCGSARRGSDDEAHAQPFAMREKARSEGTTSPVGERIKQSILSAGNSLSKMRTKVATAFHAVAQD